MCIIKTKYTKSNTFTGYKIVIEDKYGNYYSPSTGIRYNVGKVRIPKKRGIHCHERWGNSLDHNCFWYEPKYTGYTGVFKNLTDAKNKQACNTIIIQMTIKGELRNARYNCSPTIIGKEIVSMKKIKI